MNSSYQDFASEFQTIPHKTQQNKKIFPKANPSINNSLMNDFEEFNSNDGRRDEGFRRREDEGRKRREENSKKEESIIYRREEEEKRREEESWKWEDENRRKEEEIRRRDEEDRKSLKKSIFGDMKDESKILKEQFTNSVLDGEMRLSVKRGNSNTIRSDFEVLQRKYPNTGINRRNIENINLTFCLECQNFLEIDNTNLHILFCRKKSTKNAAKPKNRIFNSQVSGSNENRENLLKKLDYLDKLIFTKPSYSYPQPSPEPSSQPSSQSSSKLFSKPPINNASSSLFLPDGEYLKVLEVILIGILESIRANGGSLEIVEDLDRLKNCYLTQEKGIGQRYLLVISRVKEIVEGCLKIKEGEWVGAE